MPDEERTPADLKERAKGFLAFQYAEVKDLTKQFLTVVAAVLAVTITFSEKIVNFANAASTPRALLMFAWGACIAAFLLGGCAIFFIAAQQMVALFAQGSLWRLTLGLFCVLVLARYRSAVPLMFALLLLNYLASLVIFQFVPLSRTGTPPGPYVNLALFILTVLGLVLSLRNRGTRN